MRIAVFHNEKNRETALNAGKLIESHTSTLAYHEIERIWDKEYCRNPVALLENASHALFVYSSAELDFSSFLFLSGYCLGKGIRILVLETSEKVRIPENCRQFGIILKPDVFEEYMSAEKLRYDREEKQSWARRVLVERGIPCFEQNFLLMIESGDVDAVSLFLDAGFSPTIADAKGIPALSLAVRAQNVAIARLLLAAGADVNVPSGDRQYSPLMDAAQKGDLSMAELLLEHGAKTDLKSRDGQTALVICAGRGDVASSALLVSHGADPEVKDNLGMSASGYAKLFRNEKLMALFNITPA